MCKKFFVNLLIIINLLLLNPIIMDTVIKNVNTSVNINSKYLEQVAEIEKLRKQQISLPDKDSSNGSIIQQPFVDQSSSLISKNSIGIQTNTTNDSIKIDSPNTPIEKMYHAIKNLLISDSNSEQLLETKLVENYSQVFKNLYIGNMFSSVDIN